MAQHFVHAAITCLRQRDQLQSSQAASWLLRCTALPSTLAMQVGPLTTHTLTAPLLTGTLRLALFYDTACHAHINLGTRVCTQSTKHQPALADTARTLRSGSSSQELDSCPGGFTHIVVVVIVVRVLRGRTIVVAVVLRWPPLFFIRLPALI